MPAQAQVISFSDLLTPEQVQTVLDKLKLPWRDYTPNEAGWVDIWDNSYFNSDLGVNIIHGGYVDHYSSTIADGYPEAKGNLAHLVQQIIGCDYDQAVKWIRKVLNMTNGNIQVPNGREFVKNKIANKGEHYAMLVKSILYNKELSASAKIVWAAIQERCGAKKHYSFAGTRTIAEDTGLSRATVIRAINELKDGQFLMEKKMTNSRTVKRFPLVVSNLDRDGLKMTP